MHSNQIVITGEVASIDGDGRATIALDDGTSYQLVVPERARGKFPEGARVELQLTSSFIQMPGG